MTALTTPIRQPAAFVWAYAASHFCIYMALMMPVTLGLALRVAQLMPTHKEAGLALVLSLGAVSAMLARPLAGLLSDRTRARMGMRRPWLLGGVAAGGVGLALVGWGGYPLLCLGWCIAQLGFNASLAALAALLHDQVPLQQRGRVMGWVGMGLQLGTLAGVALARTSSGILAPLLFLLPAALALVATALLASSFDDRRLDPGVRAPLQPITLFKGFWLDPREAPDFAWLFLSRFLVSTGLWLMSSYQVYFLADSLHLPPAQVPDAVLGSTLLCSLVSVCASMAAGFLSDRWQRRKGFVVAAAAADAVGLLIISQASSYAGFLLGVALLGLGTGVHLSVGLVLVTQVLPKSGREAARHLGLFNLSATLPQAVAPALAPLLLALGGGHQSYASLMIPAALLAALGAGAVWPVRHTR